MTDHFEAILDECISAVQAGVSIDDILAEVPDYASELRPMLYMATVLTEPNPILVPTERKNALRVKYMAQVATLPPPPAPTWSDRLGAVTRIIKRRLTRRAVLSDMATITITTILTLIMALFILSYVATDAIPGDILYRFKRFAEHGQLIISFSDEQTETLNHRFNQRRLSEIEQMVSANRAGTVDFVGLLESKGENLWIVEGYPVILPDEVFVEGDPQVGDRVSIEGFLRTNGDLVADQIAGL